MPLRHITVFPQPSRGHLYPLLELSSVLVERGYHVTFAVIEAFAQKVLDTGAQPLIYENILGELSRQNHEQASGHLPQSWGLPHDPAWWEREASTTYPWLLRLATHTLEQLKSFYDANPPDLVLYDRLAFAGRVLSRQLNIKAVQLYPHFAAVRKFLYRDRGVYVNPAPMLDFARTLDSYLLRHGITTEDNLWHTEELNIYFIPREFQPDAESFDERSCFVGACLNRPFQSGWSTQAGKPVVLISDFEGGLPDKGYFNAFIDALSTPEYHVVLSIDSRTSSTAFDRLPDNFEISRHVPHLELLRHASLAICHGGTGTTLEALYHGVPVIALPATPHTAEVAYRVVELGLGTSLPRNQLTPGAIRDSVRSTLTDPAILTNVKRMQAIFRRSGGAQMAADRIERFHGEP